MYNIYISIVSMEPVFVIMILIRPAMWVMQRFFTKTLNQWLLRSCCSLLYAYTYIPWTSSPVSLTTMTTIPSTVTFWSASSMTPSSSTAAPINRTASVETLAETDPLIDSRTSASTVPFVLSLKHKGTGVRQTSSAALFVASHFVK